MKETEREAIIDGDGANKIVSVVPTLADPTKYAVVVLNAD